ncbi:DUF3995 domain-containing protein [Sulfurimonas sp. CS5]|jgi:hypothetical protein|uniref:DUF3995 domain-containing protein n=1 Tax=Sulfurimonas sp. CS5 TaxID=3391145 RepID=UPI0039E82CB8
MNFLSIVTIVVLILIAILHFYWSFGGKIGLSVALPTKDGKKLINPGKFLTFLVGIILMSFAYVAYILRFGDMNSLYIYFGWIISSIFILRAVGDFNAVGFFKKIKSTKFAIYDTRYFSPLSLYLGLVLAILSYSR